MEITTFQPANACIGMSTFGLAGMGSDVPNYAKPRQHSDARNGGLGALDAWGPPV